MEGTTGTVRTRIPARMDRLPWCSWQGEDTDLDREIDAIVKLLKEKGPLGAPTIRRELETRFWGTSRLRSALVKARRRGPVRRIGTRTFEAVSD